MDNIVDCSPSFSNTERMKYIKQATYALGMGFFLGLFSLAFSSISRTSGFVSISDLLSVNSALADPQYYMINEWTDCCASSSAC